MISLSHDLHLNFVPHPYPCYQLPSSFSTSFSPNQLPKLSSQSLQPHLPANTWRSMCPSNAPVEHVQCLNAHRNISSSHGNRKEGTIKRSPNFQCKVQTLVSLPNPTRGQLGHWKLMQLCVVRGSTRLTHSLFTSCSCLNAVKNVLFTLEVH